MASVQLALDRLAAAVDGGRGGVSEQHDALRSDIAALAAGLAAKSKPERGKPSAEPVAALLNEDAASLRRAERRCRELEAANVALERECERLKRDHRDELERYRAEGKRLQAELANVKARADEQAEQMEESRHALTRHQAAVRALRTEADALTVRNLELEARVGGDRRPAEDDEVSMHSESTSASTAAASGSEAASRRLSRLRRRFSRSSAQEPSAAPPAAARAAAPSSVATPYGVVEEAAAGRTRRARFSLSFSKKKDRSGTADRSS